MAKTLIKTDRNGTKHYHVDECPKCGGTGKYKNTTLDNFRCWKCGGTGYYPHVVKEYTEEYLAKKAEKDHAKWLEKNLKELPANIKRNTPFLTIEQPIYVVKGNTYKIKDELKANGARFSQAICAWVFDKPTDEYETVELNFNDYWFINKYNRPERKDDGIYLWELWEK